MAQRFNAPPGWNVPPDFVPSSDWQPDPSWPPAPEGWNYWVEDSSPTSVGDAPAAPPSVAAYGATQQAGGVPPTAPYGSDPAATYGTPAPGAYGSTAPGSAAAAVGEAKVAAAQKGMRGGFIAIAIGVVSAIVTVVAFDSLFWISPLLVLFGIIGAIKGAIDLKKARAALGGPAGFGPGFVPGQSVPGTTPPGQNPPGTF